MLVKHFFTFLRVFLENRHDNKRMKEKEDATTFWLRFKSLLKDYQLTQKEFCNITAIPLRTLQDWIALNRFPKADQAVLIAGALETTVEYLVTGNAPGIINDPDFLLLKSNTNIRNIIHMISMVPNERLKETKAAISGVIAGLGFFNEPGAKREKSAG